MHAVDSNVVVRLVVGDDAEQLARAKALFRKESIWIGLTVILETEWVLRGAYGFKPSPISAAFAGLAGLENVSIENPAVFMRALSLYLSGMDFADALHVSGAGATDGFRTFDKSLVKQAGRLNLSWVLEV
jgi:predicted nucleic-acid-binding protein